LTIGASSRITLLIHLLFSELASCPFTDVLWAVYSPEFQIYFRLLLPLNSSFNPACSHTTRYAWGLRHRKVHLGSRPHTCEQWKTNESSSTLDCSLCSAEYYMRDYILRSIVIHRCSSASSRKETNRGPRVTACCTFDILSSGGSGENVNGVTQKWQGDVRKRRGHIWVLDLVKRKDRIELAGLVRLEKCYAHAPPERRIHSPNRAMLLPTPLAFSNK
jgi:hypothetical protein